MKRKVSQRTPSSSSSSSRRQIENEYMFMYRSNESGIRRSSPSSSAPLFTAEEERSHSVLTPCTPLLSTKFKSVPQRIVHTKKSEEPNPVCAIGTEAIVSPTLPPHLPFSSSFCTCTNNNFLASKMREIDYFYSNNSSTSENTNSVNVYDSASLSSRIIHSIYSILSKSRHNLSSRIEYNKDRLGYEIIGMVDRRNKMSNEHSRTDPSSSSSSPHKATITTPQMKIMELEPEPGPSLSQHRQHQHRHHHNTATNTTIFNTKPHSSNFQTSSNQKKFLKSIRIYAFGICAFALCSATVICLFGGGGNGNGNSNDANGVRNMSMEATTTTTRNTRAVGEEAEAKATLLSRISSIGGSRSSGLPRVKRPSAAIEHDNDNGDSRGDGEGMMRKLREEFHEWIEHHGRDYGSEQEKEKRFHIWKENHFRTMEKNEQHGPCKLTGKKVFGSNHFKDLTHEEFKAKYLTGYAGPKTDEMDNHKRRQLRTSNEFRALMEKKEHAHPNRATPTDVLSSNGLHDPSILSDRISRHESVHERYLKHVEKTPKLSKTYYNREDKAQEKACKCGSKNYNNNNSNSNSNSNSYYNKYNDYNNYYYSSNNYGSRRLSGIFKRHSGMFGKTYYNKSEKQKICGSSYGKTYYNKNSSNNNKVDCSKYKLEADFDYDEVSNERTSSNNCGWYDMSCWMRKIFNPLFSGHTRESMYNNYNYPSSIDWRKIGAVTSVHSQGSCGACWAITATETIEAANYIATGTLLDLSETEIIICEDSCLMCDGGWPQNAYDYVEENKGLPAESSSSYDGSFLMTLTMVNSGESDEMTENEVEYIKETTCPAEGGSKDDSGSSSTRYGAIKGYAYATDRCVCYTDGSGCDCDEQNEALAVMNVASYGPATVCLEASQWQDYTGGIITADSGCSAAFLDMNHCVQVVGYAYTDVTDDDDDEEGGGSGSNSHDSGGDSSHREGYWIVRNQWSSYWGMNGYAYVAMGDNTCGILNDMTQVFME